MALLAPVGSLSRPSPSMVSEIFLSFVGVNLASFHRSSARPRESKPGPRLADVAGTLTVMVITFLTTTLAPHCVRCSAGEDTKAHEGKSVEMFFPHPFSHLSALTCTCMQVQVLC